MIPVNFNGTAKKLTSLDISKLGALIGVGEDEIHAFLEVETSGGGFDKEGRPKILFEPHVFDRNLGETKRTRARELGISYPRWGTIPYPKDSYPILTRAMAIDRAAALKACSWGIGQTLGENHKACGFVDVETMVEVYCSSEFAQLQGAINFIISNNLDDDLRRHDWSGFARGYNGAGYAKHGYHTKLAAAFKKWSKIPDTPYKSHKRIGLGSKNADVRLAQQELLAQGFDPKGVDGVFGYDTEAAAIAWQKSKGLEPDGVIGAKSWPVLLINKEA